MLLNQTQLDGNFTRAYDSQGGKMGYLTHFANKLVKEIYPETEYQTISGRTVRDRFNVFIKFAKAIGQRSHSSGTGADGETIDLDVAMYLDMKHQDDGTKVVKGNKALERRRDRFTQSKIIGNQLVM